MVLPENVEDFMETSYNKHKNFKDNEKRERGDKYSQEEKNYLF